jgi:hypothetical protein
MKGKLFLWNVVISISILTGSVIGFVVGLDIQHQREWDKGYNACRMQLMNYRNKSGKHIDVQDLILKMAGDNYNLASNN